MAVQKLKNKFFIGASIKKIAEIWDKVNEVIDYLTTIVSITNSAGANVITKSNGANLVASNVTDNGTFVTINSDVIINGQIFESAIGNVSLDTVARDLVTGAGVSVANWESQILTNPSLVNALYWDGDNNASIRIYGSNTANTHYALRVYDSALTELINFRNDGKINIGGGAAIGSTFSVRQNGGTRALDVYNTAANKQLILVEDNGAGAGFVRLADSAFQVDTYSHNVGIGIVPGTSKLRVKGDAAGQDVFNITPSAGSGGVLINDVSNHPFLYMQNASAVTKVQINTSGDSYLNGGKVSMTALPTSNAGLSTGDLYIDTSANITANGDKFVGWKV